MDVLTLAKRTIPDTHTRVIYRGEGMTDDIFARIRADIPEAISQTKVFSRCLYDACGRDAEILLRELYSFLVDNVRLCIDPIGVQYVKKPAALVFDSDRRADCKSYSIFIASVLANLNIPFRFKFCSWKPYDKNVRHVFIEAYPDDGVRRRVLDVNLKRYNTEKLPNYNNRYIDMTQIYSVGALEEGVAKRIKRDSLLDGRDVRRVTDVELDLRIDRQGLRNERDAVSAICGIGSTECEAYNDSIDMINDLIGEVVAMCDSSNFSNMEERIAGIGYDYVTGAYSLSGVGVGGIFSSLKKSLNDPKNIAAMTATKKKSTSKSSRLNNRFWLRKKRLAAIRNKRGHKISDIEAIDPYIGGYFSKIKKGVAKVAKSSVKVVANTVKKTTKAVATVSKKATTGTLKMVKASVMAPAALVSSKARKELKKTVKSAASDAKDVAKSTKDVLTVPLAAATAEILENYLPKCGTFFLYCFMDDKTAAKCPSNVKNKRNKAIRLRKFIVNVIGVSGSQFDKICRNSVVKEYGKTPEAVIADRMKGVAGIGVAVASVISAIIAIINLLMKVFGKKSPDNVSSSDMESPDDFSGIFKNVLDATDKVVDAEQNIKQAINDKTASAMTYANNNLTTLQKLTGSSQSLVTNAAADLTDTMNATATKATDALTNREVDNSGTQKGSADALKVEATKSEASASSSLGIKTPYIIGGAVLLLGGVMMMKKK